MKMKPQTDLALNLLVFAVIIFMLGMLSMIVLEVATNPNISMITLGMVLIGSLYVLGAFAIIGCVKDMRKLIKEGRG